MSLIPRLHRDGPHGGGPVGAGPGRAGGGRGGADAGGRAYVDAPVVAHPGMKSNPFNLWKYSFNCISLDNQTPTDHIDTIFSPEFNLSVVETQSETQKGAGGQSFK